MRIFHHFIAALIVWGIIIVAVMRLVMINADAQPTGANSPAVAPPGAFMVVGVGTGTTGAVTASLVANTAKTNYICGADISAIGGTATIGPITVTGLTAGTTFTYQIASTATGNLLPLRFSPCVPGNAINTAISVATTADGTATAVDVNVWGYVQ